MARCVNQPPPHLVRQTESVAADAQGEEGAHGRWRHNGIAFRTSEATCSSGRTIGDVRCSDGGRLQQWRQQLAQQQPWMPLGLLADHVQEQQATLGVQRLDAAEHGVAQRERE
jgi:hypothetical protein